MRVPFSTTSRASTWWLLMVLLSSITFTAEATKYIRIGGLFNQFVANYTTMSSAGTQQLAAFLMAIREINNNSQILPGYKIVTSINNANGYFNTIQSTMDLVQSTFPSKGGLTAGIDAVVGAVPNAETIAANSMLQSDGIQTVLVSATADDATLASGTAYPYQISVIPSEAFDGFILEDLIYKRFGYRHLTVFSTNDYFSEKQTAFFTSGYFGSFNILSTHTVVAGTGDFTPQIAAAKAAGALVFVLFLDTQEVVDLLIQGRRSGLFTEHSLIFVNARCASSGTIQEFQSRGNTEFTAAQLFANVIGTNFDPKFALNKSPQGLKFLKAWRSQKSTILPTSSKNKLPCNVSATDDSGTFKLYVNPKNTTCAALNFANFAADGSDLDPYAALVYDGTYALAYAMQILLLKMKKTAITGDDLHKVLINNVTFMGATGIVQFFPGIPPGGTAASTNDYYGMGDRIVGAVCSLVSYFPDSNSFESVGRWSMDGQFQFCDYMVSQTVANGIMPVGLLPCTRKFTYAGSSGTRPVDRYENIINWMSQQYSDIVLALGLIGVGITVFVSVVLIVYRESRLVKASQPVMMAIILFGEILGGLRAFASFGPPSYEICSSHEWLGHMSFILVFGGLNVKQWRVDKLFNATSLKRVKVTTLDSLIRNSVQVCGFLIYLAFLQGFGVPTVRNLETVSANRVTVTPYCSLENNAFEIALYVMEGILLIRGAYLCYRVRGVPDAVNESKSIERAMIVIFLICMVLLPLRYLLPDLDPNVQELMTGVGFAVAVIETSIHIFMPKCIILLQGLDMDRDMKVDKGKKADEPKVYAVDTVEALIGDENKTKALLDASKRALKGCKTHDEKYALAQTQAAWWRSQAMELQQLDTGSGSGSGGDGSGPASGQGSHRNNSVQEDTSTFEVITEAAALLNNADMNTNASSPDGSSTPIGFERVYDANDVEANKKPTA